MIKQLGLVNFRGRTVTYDFGPGANSIRGKNESGKSSIKEALSFVWDGTDAAGNKNPDHLITQGEDVMEVVAVTEFISIARKKRRGATSTIKITRHGFPPVAMTQTELGAMLKISPNAFKSCWIAGFFMSLDNEAKLAVLAELAQLDRKSLLMNQLPAGFVLTSKVKLVNPRVDADAVAGERRQLQNMKSSDEGGLAQVDAQLKQLTGHEEVDVESYSSRLNEIHAALESFDLYQKNLAQYQANQARFDEMQKRKASLLQEMKGLTVESLPGDHEEKIQTSLKSAESAKAKHAGLAVTYKSAPHAPKKPGSWKAGDTCTACGQGVGDAHLAHMAKQYEDILLEFNRTAREVETHNSSVKDEMDRLQKIGTEYVNAHNALKAQQDAHLRQKAAVSARLEAISKELAAIDAQKPPQAPQRPAGEDAALRKEHLDISTQVNVARRVETQSAGLKEQRRLLLDQVAVRQKQINDYTHLEKALRELPTLETKTMLAGLHVEGVHVDLVEGKIDVSVGSIPYASLSSGRSMKTDIEFCKSLRRAAGTRAPKWLYVDNTDLMDKFYDLLPQDLQCFVAQVDAAVDDVKVVAL